MNKNLKLILKFFLLVGSFVFFLLITMSVHSNDTTKLEYQTFIYKKVDSQALKLDVFEPVKTANTQERYPVIILFHGGGWVAGDRSKLHLLCQFFMQQGIIAISADYRFKEKGGQGYRGTKEICIRDAKSAIRWIKVHHDQLHIDTSKIILGGGSAGGHIATMAALDSKINDPADNISISTTARALVLFNPAYNPKGRGYLQPFSLISSKTPSVIMFFGSEDKWKDRADPFYSLLKKQNINSEMWIAQGQKHGFYHKMPWRRAACKRALVFLAKYGLIKDKVSSSQFDNILKLEH